MGSVRWARLGWLCALVALAASAPLDDTMVVTKVDEQSSTPASSTASTTKLEELTTEEPTEPIKLTEMDVRSEVTMRYAHTAVVTYVKNPAKKAQEATFRVLLPETAFISGFTMTLDGKAYKAYVKEKEEAKQIYTQAVSQGLGAAHIAAKARDSNHFTVSVNVEPNTVAIFNLTYEELLLRRNKVYNHAINLHPGELVPKLTVTVHIKEGQKITQLRVPEVRTGNEVDATDEDAQNSKAVIERKNDDKEATITFTPDLEEQKRLRDIYAEKTKESQAHSVSRYSYYDEPKEQQPQDGVLGQFVVQYNVDRSNTGEVLVNDGYFVHFFAPESLPPLNKHVVFVLDTSGSMYDRKIVQLREAMQTILSELNEGDYFSLVSFASYVTVLDLKDADKEPPKSQNSYNIFYEKPVEPKLIPPYPATKENIAKAKELVKQLNANGGTNIDSALSVAIDLIQKGTGWTPTEAPGADKTTEASVKPAEGQPTTAVPTTSSTTTETAKVAVQDEKAKDDSKKLEPVIIFLTDGDPTVGETNPKRIMSRIAEKNDGERKASIFSLAFGEDADRKFLRKLSLKNDGFMRHIYEAADAALQLRDFYRQVASPLLANVEFVYPKEQIKEGSVTKNKFRTYYLGSEAVVAGQYDNVENFKPVVHGICGVGLEGDQERKFYEVIPPVVRNKGEYLPLERLWAYLTIKQLLDERDAAEDRDLPDKDGEDTPEKKALKIALKYEFVTPLTSLVVVKPNDTNAVDAESVDNADANGGPFPSYSVDRIFSGGPSASYANAGYAQAAFAGMPGAPAAAFYPQPLLSVGGYQQPVDLAEHVSADALEFAEESTDYDGAHRSGYSPSIQYQYHSSHHLVDTRISLDDFVPKDIVMLTTTSRPVNDPIVSDVVDLAEYHLEDFSWVQPLVNKSADSIILPANQTSLRLTKDSVAPKKQNGDEDCARTTEGAAGVCVYLTRCETAKHITVEQYSQTYCAVSNQYAGICCAKDKVDVSH